MNKEKDDLRKMAEDMILSDNDISSEDKLEMLDEDLNDDILSEDWGFVEDLQCDGSDIEFGNSTLEETDDPGIAGW